VNILSALEYGQSEAASDSDICLISIDGVKMNTHSSFLLLFSNLFRIVKKKSSCNADIPDAIYVPIKSTSLKCLLGFLSCGVLFSSTLHLIEEVCLAAQLLGISTTSFSINGTTRPSIHTDEDHIDVKEEKFFEMPERFSSDYFLPNGLNNNIKIERDDSPEAIHQEDIYDPVSRPIKTDNNDEEVKEDIKTCTVCGKISSNLKNLRSHMKIHTSRIVKCPICIPDKFIKEIGLKKHIKACHKPRDIPCDIPGCTKMFKLKEIMHTHIKNVHNGERKLCPHCGADVINLSYHLEKCNRDNLDHVTCKICLKQYASKTILNLHERTIHGLDNTLKECAVCGKTVKDIRSHMKINHSDTTLRTRQCPVEDCKKMFRTKQEVENHINSIHLDIKSQCSICFLWFKNLSDHIGQVHKGGKKYRCGECDKQFSRNFGLKQHVERVHKSTK